MTRKQYLHDQIVAVLDKVFENEELVKRFAKEDWYYSPNHPIHNIGARLANDICKICSRNGCDCDSDCCPVSEYLDLPVDYGDFQGIIQSELERLKELMDK